MSIENPLHAGAGLASQPAVRYVIDAAMSRFTVRATATGLLSAFGHNPTIAIRDYIGEVTVAPDNLESSSVHITIRADSLTVTDDISDKDRREMERQMRDEVLEAGRFPEIVFDCSRLTASKTGEGQYWVALNGELTLHGVTRGQNVAARASLDGDTMRANGNFSLKQTDYDIKLVSAVAGTLKVKDELQFSFDVVARRKP